MDNHMLSALHLPFLSPSPPANLSSPLFIKRNPIDQVIQNHTTIIGHNNVKVGPEDTKQAMHEEVGGESDSQSAGL
jgi:hypothetical protein